jgi:hypothetical protein
MGTAISCATIAATALLIRLLTVIIHSYWPGVPIIPFWHAVGMVIVGTLVGVVWFKGLIKAHDVATY